MFLKPTELCGFLIFYCCQQYLSVDKYSIKTFLKRWYLHILHFFPNNFLWNLFPRRALCIALKQNSWVLKKYYSFNSSIVLFCPFDQRFTSLDCGIGSIKTYHFFCLQSRLQPFVGQLPNSRLQLRVKLDPKNIPPNIICADHHHLKLVQPGRFSCCRGPIKIISLPGTADHTP